MKVFYLRALVATGLLSVIADRAYGGIEHDVVASGARTLEQETGKRQLRAHATAESEPEDRTGGLTFLNGVLPIEEEAKSVVALVKEKQLDHLIDHVFGDSLAQEAYLKFRLRQAWGSTSWTKQLTVAKFIEVVRSMEQADGKIVLQLALVEPSKLDGKVAAKPVVATSLNIKPSPDVVHPGILNPGLVSLQSPHPDILQGAIERFQEALAKTKAKQHVPSQ